MVITFYNYKIVVAFSCLKMISYSCLSRAMLRKRGMKSIDILYDNLKTRCSIA